MTASARRVRLTRRAFTAALLAGGVHPIARARQAPLVAAAANLQFALEELAADHAARSGQTVRLTFGASGNLTRQIEQGAPFELFLSADESFVFRLADAGLTRDRGALYARGRLALFVPNASTLDVAGGLAELARALDADRIRRFSIANPSHAPYGRAAEQALRAAGLWERLGPYRVLGENVSQAAQFVASGHADAGLVAYSLVVAPTVAARGRSSVVSEALHAPLNHRMVMTTHATADVEGFYRYLLSASARPIIERFGYAPAD